MSTSLLLDASRAAQLFHALSDETRLGVLDLLRSGEQCVCDLQVALDVAQSRLSFHLKVLKDAGLVVDRREGRWSYYRLQPSVLDEVHDAVRALSGDPMSEITQIVREKYGDAARRVLALADSTMVGDDTAASSCCAPSCCGGDAFNGSTDPITSNLYVSGETDVLPESAVLASLGCGNPTALAELAEGEVVLDLGSGGGIDVLLSARRVGPTGKVYGLDMTDDMLALARRNAAEAQVSNVEFLKGQIEQIPLPDNSVDVIISNCVINLSADKQQVLREAFRVLKPGGRFAVSDVIVRGEVPADVRRSMELWVGCVAGAVEESQFLTMLADTGFEGASIEPTRMYRSEDARLFLEEAGVDVDATLDLIDGRFMAGFVRATKPGTARIGS